jgi:penicillin-insensitive murein DD-endopeptidase
MPTSCSRAALSSTLALAFVLCTGATARATPSTCFGTPAHGRLENGVKLPSSGSNFLPYSSFGVAAGRTFVHSAVRDVVVTAFGKLEATAPGKVYVYGETGFRSGRRFKPHRTHQNGLSVDFMVPVTDAAGRSVPLPAGISNKFGYDIEFDAAARYGEYAIDFEALAEHLYQLNLAARATGAPITRVIFEQAYLPQLFATRRGSELQKSINFMLGKPWVRHDEHYHVDFALPCRPLGTAPRLKKPGPSGTTGGSPS